MAKKITRKQLSRVIREEVKRILNEDDSEYGEFQPGRKAATAQHATNLDSIEHMAVWWLGKEAYEQAKQRGYASRVTAGDVKADASMNRPGRLDPGELIGTYGGFLGFIYKYDYKIGEKISDATDERANLDKERVIARLIKDGEIALKLNKSVSDKLQESIEIFTDFVKSSGAASVRGRMGSTENFINRLDREARTLKSLFDTGGYADSAVSKPGGGAALLHDPRNFIKVAQRLGSELERVVSELGSYQEQHMQNQLSDDDRDKLEDTASLQESKKSSNRLILENHRRGRGVHPAVHREWWYGDK